MRSTLQLGIGTEQVRSRADRAQVLAPQVPAGGLALDGLRDAPDGVADIADHLQLREVHLVHLHTGAMTTLSVGVPVCFCSVLRDRVLEHTNMKTLAEYDQCMDSQRNNFKVGSVGSIA